MPILENMSQLEMILIALLVVETAIVNLWLHSNGKLHALDDKTLADLKGQIDRMMDTAPDSAASDILWAARVPDGACAGKLRRAGRTP